MQIIFEHVLILTMTMGGGYCTIGGVWYIILAVAAASCLLAATTYTKQTRYHFTVQITIQQYYT